MNIHGKTMWVRLLLDATECWIDEHDGLSSAEEQLAQMIVLRSRIESWGTVEPKERLEALAEKWATPRGPGRFTYQQGRTDSRNKCADELRALIEEIF